MIRNPRCDWCVREGNFGVDAMFVVVTGNIDSQKIEDWYVCVRHADHICSKRNSKRIIVSGIMIDLWQLNAINNQAREYHNLCRDHGGFVPA